MEPGSQGDVLLYLAANGHPHMISVYGTLIPLQGLDLSGVHQPTSAEEATSLVSTDVAQRPAMLETQQQYSDAISHMFPQSAPQAQPEMEGVQQHMAVAAPAVALEGEAPLVLSPPVRGFAHTPTPIYAPPTPLTQGLLPSAESQSAPSLTQEIIETPVAETTGDFLTSSTSTSAETSAAEFTSLPHLSSALHPAQFYVGVVLGTIAALVCMAALGVWWIRVRTANRRRARMAGAISWRGDSFNEKPGAYMDSAGQVDVEGSRALEIDGVQIVPHAWEPSGDRDVGEPKRSESYEAARAIRGQPARKAVPPMGVVLPCLSYSFAATPQPSTQDTQFSLPAPWQADPMGTPTTENPLGALKVANKMPGDGLSSAETSRAGTSLGVITSTFPHETAHPQRTIASGAPALTLGNSNNSALSTTAEAWTSSLKANLVSAFNAVAAGIQPGSPTIDRLTPAPNRRGNSGRRAVSAEWREPHAGEGAAGLSRRSTVASGGWTLEDRGDGSGIVRIRGLDNGDSGTPRNTKLRSVRRPLEGCGRGVPGASNALGERRDERRPSFIMRASSSNASASSDGSAASQMSELTDPEQEARKVLEERRRKLREVKVLRQARRSRRKGTRASVRKYERLL